MHLLYLASVAFWIVIAYTSLRTFLRLKDAPVQREVVPVTIFLLSCLNICRGTLAAFVGQPELIPGQRLVEYFYIGSSMFQILLCAFVLKFLKKTN